jgi:hypothetical protein
VKDLEATPDLVTLKIARYNLSDIRNGAVLKRIESAIATRELRLENLQQKIVFDSLCEGHGPREMRAVLDSLSQCEWYDPKRIVFLHNSLDTIPADVKQIAWSWYMVNHSNWLHNLLKIDFDWQSHNKDRWFLCIMRRRSEQRSRFLKKLLDTFDQSQCRLSYASMIDYQAFDDIAQVSIPMLLDGPTPGNEQHLARDPRIFNCLVNVIAETSCQETEGDCWSSSFITEKTFKCFGWRQVPIWFASPGLVQAVRSLGFDVFDDLIDHDSYDLIHDPVERMACVIENLEGFLARYSSCTPEELFFELTPRIEKNWQTLLALDSKKSHHWATIMERIHEL